MEETFTINEIARILKLNPGTVRRKARERKKGWFKIGTEWRITKSNLDSWIKELEEEMYNEAVN